MDALGYRASLRQERTSPWPVLTETVTLEAEDKAEDTRWFTGTGLQRTPGGSGQTRRHAACPGVR